MARTDELMSRHRSVSSNIALPVLGCNASYIDVRQVYHYYLARLASHLWIKNGDTTLQIQLFNQIIYNLIVKLEIDRLTHHHKTA